MRARNICIKSLVTIREDCILKSRRFAVSVGVYKRKTARRGRTVPVSEDFPA